MSFIERIANDGGVHRARNHTFMDTQNSDKVRSDKVLSECKRYFERDTAETKQDFPTLYTVEYLVDDENVEDARAHVAPIVATS